MALPAPIPADEAPRLSALRALLVRETGPEPVFDSIAQLAAEICGTPIALLNLVGDQRQWFEAHLDPQAQALSQVQLRMLASLAKVATDALAMRRDLSHPSLSMGGACEGQRRHSESHYRAIVEDQAEMISLARPDGELTYVNKAYAAHFGLAASDMVGQNLFDFIKPEDRDLVRQVLDDVLRTGCSTRNDNRMLGADGAERWVAWTNGARRYEPDGIVLHSVGRDISARKRAEQELRSSQSFLYRTGRVAGVGGWELDLATSSLRWSDETRRIHDVDADYQPTLDSAIAFYAVDARAAMQGAVAKALDTGEAWDLELPLVTAKGRSIWVRAVGEVECEAGQPTRLVGAFQDVTQRKQLEFRLAAQTATLSLVTEAIPATVAVVDLNGRYRFVNSAFERSAGQLREQVLGRTVREVLGEQAFERQWPWFQRALAGEAVVFELDNPGHEGALHLSHNCVPLRLSTGELDGFVAVSQDVTEQKREASRLLEMSQRDPLTGLKNRAGFERYLERSLADGGGLHLALLYIDLDGFKAVNDVHGHAAGDLVLQAFSQRLAGLVRPTDAVARLGGDEFAVALLAVREPANAWTVANKVLKAARTPFEINHTEVCIGASIGVAFGADPVSGWSELIERADAKLLSAKALGKGQQQGALP